MILNAQTSSHLNNFNTHHTFRNDPIKAVIKTDNRDLWLVSSNIIVKAQGNHQTRIKFPTLAAGGSTKVTLAEHEDYLFISRNTELFYVDKESLEVFTFSPLSLRDTDSIIDVYIQGDAQLVLITAQQIITSQLQYTANQLVLSSPNTLYDFGDMSLVLDSIRYQDQLIIIDYFKGYAAIDINRLANVNTLSQDINYNHISNNKKYVGVSVVESGLFISTEKGLFQVNLQDEGQTIQTSHQPFISSMHDKNQQVTYFDYNQNLEIVFDEFNDSILARSSSLEPIRFSTKYLDSESNLYLATKELGLKSYSPFQTKIYPAKHSDKHYQKDLIIDNSGALWFAGKKGLISPTGKKVLSTPIYAASKVSDYFVFASRGKLVLSKDLSYFESFISRGFERAYIDQIIRLDPERVLVDGFGAPIRLFNLKTKRFENTLDYGLDYQYFTENRLLNSYHLNSEQTLLFSQKSALLFSASTKTFIKTFEFKNQQFISAANDLLFTNNGDVYQFLLTDNSYKLQLVFSPANHLAELLCTARSVNDELWSVTQSGLLMKFDPRTQKTQEFTETSGIPEVGLNGKMCTIIDEFLYVSSNVGIYKIHTTRFPQNKQQPEIFIAKHNAIEKPSNDTQNVIMELADKDLPLIIAAYHSSYIDLVNSPISFRINQGKWRQSFDGEIKLDFLPTGSHNIQIRGVNNDGVYSDIKTIDLSILPPIWLTWWAKLIYILLLIGLIFLFYAQRLRRAQHKAQLLEETVKQRTKELAHEKKNVEQLLQYKEQELVNVSHELRTPITLVAGPVKNLLDDITDTEHRAKLSIAYRNSQRLIRIVDQLLTLDRIRAHSVLARKPQPIGDICEYIVESFQMIAEKKRIKLKLDNQFSGSLLLIPDAFERIIVNLISNALKYTSKNGQVDVALSLNEPMVTTLTIKDNGAGISEAELEHIFAKFYRITNEQSEKIIGAGVGLSVVKELVSLHDATVSVSSEFNKGSVFTVNFPATIYTTKEKHKFTSSQIVDREIDAFASDMSPITKSEVFIQPSDEKPIVLVIEDNLDMQQYIAQVLSNKYQCVLADNGKEGFELAKQYIPDLIITDLMMPIMDGYDTTKALKDELVTSHIPVIMLTARGDVSSRKKGWQSLADEYLSKPFDEEELLIRAENILAIRALLRLKFSAEITEKGTLNQSRVTHTNQKDAEFMRRLQDLIDKHFANPDFNVDDLAQQIYMSKRQLQRKLKMLTDHSPVEYLRIHRLNQAKQLIEQGHSVSIAAEQAGFSSTTYLGRCFKAHFGVTASDYQSQNQP
jgi:signal transduction histidine kinase/DNA-binding response OmpR family regulator